MIYDIFTFLLKHNFSSIGILILLIALTSYIIDKLNSIEFNNSFFEFIRISFKTLSIILLVLFIILIILMLIYTFTPVGKTISFGSNIIL